MTPLLPRQLTLSHVARVEARLVSPRQLALTCTAERIALSAALVTADALRPREHSPLGHVGLKPVPKAKWVLPRSCHLRVPPVP